MTYNDEELIQITESLKQEWLDKACKWLEEHADTYIGVEGLPILSDNFFSDFNKAMED